MEKIVLAGYDRVSFIRKSFDAEAFEDGLYQALEGAINPLHGAEKVIDYLRKQKVILTT